MRKYTQADFDAIRRDKRGWKNLPSGDWSGVNFRGECNLIFDDDCILGQGCVFGARCRFGARWIFGAGCIFGDGCIFGAMCRFGANCMFGAGCMFGIRCVFGASCEFKAECVFGNMCMFSAKCGFGIGCKFGAECKFGEFCMFCSGCEFAEQCVFLKACVLDEGCKMEDDAVKNAVFFKVSNIGRRYDDAYAYCNTKTGEIFVRAGCWFGRIDAFEKRVHEVHAGTEYERDYIAFCEFARARFARYRCV